MAFLSGLTIGLMACFLGGMPLQSKRQQQPPNTPVMDDSRPSASNRSDSSATPQLHTAGVRGSIDAGGYSAPATAKTQSALMTEILQLQLNALRPAYGVKVTLPCDLEPSITHAVEAHPEDFTPKVRAGQFYLQHAQPAKALLYLEQAYHLNALDGEVLRWLALADLQMHQPGNALDLVSPSLPREADSVELRDLAGIAAKLLEKVDMAEEQFRRAAEYQSSERNSFVWGTELFLLGRAERAYEVFRQAIVRYPQSTMLQVGIGAALYSEGRTSEALETLLHAAEANPSSPAPYTLIAGILDTSTVQVSPRVEERLKSLLVLVPKNPRAHVAYALSLWKEKGVAGEATQSQEIENLLRRAVTLDPAFAKAHFKLASLYAERGQYALAIPEYRKTTEADPDLVEVHYRLGQAYLRVGQAQLAEQELALHQQLRAAQKQSTEGRDSMMDKFLPAVSGEGGLWGFVPCATAIP